MYVPKKQNPMITINSKYDLYHCLIIFILVFDKSLLKKTSRAFSFFNREQYRMPYLIKRHPAKRAAYITIEKI